MHTNSLSRTASWVAVNKESSEAVFETFQESIIEKLNTTKYKAVPILEYLQSLNKGGK